MKSKPSDVSRKITFKMELRFFALLILLDFGNFVIIAEVPNSECIVQLNSCEYTLKLLPRGQGQGQCQNIQLQDGPVSSFHRIKRSYDKKYKDDPYANDNNDDDKKDKFKGGSKFEKKVLKTLNQLSVRLLRGVRRIEAQVGVMDSLQEKAKGPTKKCPIGFTTVDNWPSCYMFSNFDMSWYQAKDYCAAFDSDLVSLGTTREHFIITFLIKNNKEYKAAQGWWTSGSFVTKTKQWMWTAQLFLKPFSFIKWASGEPNEAAAQCMMLASKDDHLWNDELCTKRFNFVCEADARGV